METHLNHDQRASLALGLATAEETASWRRHLEQCEICREALRADEQILRGLESLPLPQPTAAQWDERVTAALARARSAAPQPVRTIDDRRAGVDDSLKIPAWAWRAALLALVFGAGYWVRGLGAHDAGLQPQPITLIQPTAALDQPRPCNSSGQNFTESSPAARQDSGREFLLVRSDDCQTRITGF